MKNIIFLDIDGVHIQISVSTENVNTIGGLLNDGCIVSTTAEVVLNIFNNIKYKREYDEKTGYNELVINKCAK